MKRKGIDKRMLSRRCLWKDASFTLEASLLMPMILFVLMLILTGAVVLHDICAAAYNAEAISICGRMLAVGHSEDADAAISDFIAEEGDRGFLMTDAAAAGGEIGTAEITASVSGSVQNVFTAFFASSGWPVWSTFSASEEDWFVDPCTLIREARILIGENENE